MGVFEGFNHFELETLALDLSFQKLFEAIIFNFAKHTMS
jgi:hypothetical protein